MADQNERGLRRGRKSVRYTAARSRKLLVKFPRAVRPILGRIGLSFIVLPWKNLI